MSPYRLPLTALLALTFALSACEEKDGPGILPANQHHLNADDDDDDASILPADDDDSGYDGEDPWDDFPEECEDELAAADACWENAETDEEIDACFELEDALWECAGWDDWYDDEDPCEDDDWAEGCEEELEAADACWENAETDEDFDACWPLEEELLECLGIDLDDPVEAYDEE